MSLINHKIQERLKKVEGKPKKQFSISIRTEHIEQLDLIAKTLSEQSGRCTTRNMLIEDAVEDYIEQAVATLHANGIELNPKAFEARNTFDTVVFPAHTEGFEQIFLRQKTWGYVRVKKEKISQIKYVAIYVGTPVSKITHYAKVAPHGFVYSDNEKKYHIQFEGDPIPLNRPVPLGTISAASTRSPRYTTLQRLFTAEEYKDL